MRTLSKSKLMAYRQCPKRLWLEVHKPELRIDSNQTQMSFVVGNNVGEIARAVYDPSGMGAIVDIQKEGFKEALTRSKELLQMAIPVFEAGFSAGGGLAFADVMLPDEVDGIRAWHMIEIKSSGSVKSQYNDDIAIQSYIARSAGVLLKSVSLAHIDTSWIYPGDGNYEGLFKKIDLTEEVVAREPEVKTWITEAHAVASMSSEPFNVVGSHCNVPYACGFNEYCNRDTPKPQYPVQWLPRFASAKVEDLASKGIYDFTDVPDDMLNAKQLLVKSHTLNNTIYFDTIGAKECFDGLPAPVYFLDFETIMFAIPIWKGTRPYQKVTFQFSLHSVSDTEELSHYEFLDLSGDNPSEAFAIALINACGINGPVFVYNAGFETSCIRGLADQFPHFSAALLAINERVVDLLPIVRDHFYHPSQHGSWSIKDVLPAMVPELNYSDLDEVQNGGMAMNAYLEGINKATTFERKEQIRKQLLAYCKLDTFAMVRVWEVLTGRKKLH